jgi:hypothetical protein
MQKVQIYIDGNRVELFKDETINLNQTIKNVKDFSKIFTEFTQTFTIPSSKSNNLIFKHYYRADIVGGFDAKKKVSSEIKLNGVTFKKGFIQMMGAKLERGACLSYSISFVGNTVSLKELIKDDELSDLTWLDGFDTVYSASDINIGLQTGVDKFVDGINRTDCLITPLISHTKNLYYDSVSNQGGDDGNMYPQGGSQNCGLDWYDLKYSIRLAHIVQAIEEEYGITFSTDFFDSSNSVYWGLYMWLHRNSGSVGGDDKNTSNIILNYVNKLPIYSSAGISITPTEIKQQGVGIFSSTADIYVTLSVSSATATFDYLLLDENNAVVQQVLGQTGSLSYSIPMFTTSNNKTYRIAFRSNDVFTLNSTSTIRVVVTNTSTGITTDDTNNFTANQIMAQETSFIIRQQIPKMKVMDFLSGLFKTFNLTAYVQDDDVIKIQTLDDYYASGTTHDITKYVDVSSAEVSPAIPYSNLKLGFKDYKTYTASLYSSINGSEFGELDYKGENPDEWVGNTYDITLPFQKMTYNRIIDLADSSNTTCQVGWSVDDGLKPIIGSPLIHYTYRRLGGTGIAFSSTGLNGSYNSISSYHIPLNSEDIFATGQSLNFYPENDEYTQTVNTNTLFETYYRNSLVDLFEPQKRLFKFTAILPLRVLLKYTLADKFEIDNKTYKINSIKTNLQTGESKLELLNDL